MKVPAAHPEVPRPALLHQVSLRLAESPVTVLLGARQTGKTTLARMVAREHPEVRFFDLEVATDRAALSTAPERVLGGASGLVVLDEVQRMPSLLEVLRPLADRPGSPARFLLLGSTSPELVRGASISTVRSGMPQNWRGLSHRPRRPRGTTSTFLPEPTWCGCCRPGTRTSASAR